MTDFEKTVKELGDCDEEILGDGLDSLVRVQDIVSSLVPGAVPGWKDPVTNEQITTTAFALIGEVFELVQEVGWKPWKKNEEITLEKQERVLDEFGDVLAFLGLLIILIQIRFSIDSYDMASWYVKQTSVKNVKRFYGVSGEDGYEKLTKGDNNDDS